MARDQEQQTRDALLKFNQAAKEVQHLELCTNAFQSHTNRGLQIDTNYKTMQRVAEKKKINQVYRIRTYQQQQLKKKTSTRYGAFINHVKRLIVTELPILVAKM